MNEGVIAPGNHIILIRCAEHHPYRRSTSAPIVPTMQNAVPRLIHRLWRSPFPEGEGFARYHLYPHRLYSERSGRQIAAPTCTLEGGSV